MESAKETKLTISWFSCAIPTGGPALGMPERLTWETFCGVMAQRREGEKDGPGFVPARFRLEPDGRQVRRKKDHLLARTAIALDIEPNKATGELPPPPQDALARVKSKGMACVVYTSHNHKPEIDPRYRIVFPISAEISCDIPAPEIMAHALDLDGVLDRSKIGASSFFYSPSHPDFIDDIHWTGLCDGAPVDSGWLAKEGAAILALRQAEQEKIAHAAQEAAAQRLADKIAAGINPDDSLIEKIRVHLDLDSILRAHGYANQGRDYRHPNSSSGCFGANIKNLGGVDRVFSHNATDPLHASNLPEWCGGVTALDAFDVTAILDYSGDRKKALSGLAKRFNISNEQEKKELSRFIFDMVRRKVDHKDMEAQSFEKGAALGLSKEDVCSVAQWVFNTAKAK